MLNKIIMKACIIINFINLIDLATTSFAIHCQDVFSHNTFPRVVRKITFIFNLYFDQNTINIYRNMTCDGNVNQAEINLEYLWLLLIQFRLPDPLIYSHMWFNLMKLWWHSSNILSLYCNPYSNFPTLNLPVDAALFESLLVCHVVAESWQMHKTVEGSHRGD